MFQYNADTGCFYIYQIVNGTTYFMVNNPAIRLNDPSQIHLTTIKPTIEPNDYNNNLIYD
jgi:hypothetical protein